MVLVTLSIMHAGILPEKTAMFYTAAYSKYLNKEISLNVTHVQPNISADKKLKKGVRCFTLHTSYVQRSTQRIIGGGSIQTFIPDKQLIEFLKRFGLVEERTEAEKGKRSKVILKSFSGVLMYDQEDGLFVLPIEYAKVSPFSSSKEDLFVSRLTSATSGLSSKMKQALLKYIDKLSTQPDAE